MKNKVRICALIVAFSHFFTFSVMFPLQAQVTSHSLTLSQKKAYRTLGPVKSEDENGLGKDAEVGLNSIPSTGPGSQSPIYYTVHILGEVGRPGTYRIFPSDRLTDAITYAGGFLPGGSRSSIKIKRGSETHVYDFFRYTYNGDLKENPFLMENDIVLIPLKKGEVQIEGSVRRPGLYEMVRISSLMDLVKKAGGFATGHSVLEPIRIIRFDKHEKKQILKVENDPAVMSSFQIEKGDVVVVPHVMTAKKKFDYSLSQIPGGNIFLPTVDDNVYVVGAVDQPGAYPFQPDLMLRQYVNMAGPTKDSRLGSIKLIRPDGRKTRIDKKSAINAGDTIFVPERYWRAETILGIVASTLGVTFSSLALVQYFKDNN